MSNTTPRMTKVEYLAFQRGINRRILFDGMTLQTKSCPDFAAIDFT
jgi:hypothetical protein